MLETLWSLTRRAAFTIILAMNKMQNQHAIRFNDDDVDSLNELRRAEPDLPTFAEMVRRLVRRAAADHRAALKNTRAHKPAREALESAE